METIHQALTGEARRDEAAALLSQVIDQNRLEIERRWLARVQADVADRPGISLTQLRDGLPDYLVAVVGQLRLSGAVDIEARSESVWSKVARDHGVTRVRLGFDITQLIHEFIVPQTCHSRHP